MARAEMRITEFMYRGYDGPGAHRDGEFVEFTNVGNSPVDMTGWYFDDENAFDVQPGHVPEPFDLSSFGLVLPGESVILTSETPGGFRTAWGISGETKIIGFFGTQWGNNLGRNDELNLFDAEHNLVDQLRYGDNQYFPGSVRTQMSSANPTTLASLGVNDIYQWQLSYEGDHLGSWLSAYGEVGNPGQYISIPGDFNYDGVVDLEDLSHWETHFGKSHQVPTDGHDFLLWQREISRGASPLAVAEVVPEPGSATLLLIFAVGRLLRSGSKVLR